MAHLDMYRVGGITAYIIRVKRHWTSSLAGQTLYNLSHLESGIKGSRIYKGKIFVKERMRQFYK